MVDITVNIDRAYDELRSIDTDLAALNGRSLQDRTRKRIASSDSFTGPNRGIERRVTDVGGSRRIIVSTSNNGSADRFGSKRGRFEDGEDDFQEAPRRTVPSSVVMPTIETKSREATITEMKKTEKKEDKSRNKRLFGNLLVGTLRQFQKEEKVVGTNTKVQVEKQREVERRLEQLKSEDKRKIQQDKAELLRKRQEKEREILRLKRRKAIIQYSEEKIKHYKNLQLSIQTQAKPALFYLPAKHTLRTLELLKKSSDKIETLITARREQTERELRKDEGNNSDDDTVVAGVRSAVVSVDKLRKSTEAEKADESDSEFEDEDYAESSAQVRSKGTVGGAVEEVSSKPPQNGERNGNKSPAHSENGEDEAVNEDAPARPKSAHDSVHSEDGDPSGDEEEK